MKFSKPVKSLLRFTPNEKRGIVVLLLLLLVVIIVRLTITMWFNPDDSLEDTVEIATVDLNQSLDKDIEDQPKEISKKLVEKKPQRDTSLVIDPNICARSDLIAIGFSRFSADNLIKYRNKGGFFKKPDDLSRIYGVEKSFIEEIHFQLSFPQKIDEEIPQQEVICLELNSVDTIDIQKIPFIGPVRGSRIIKYRNKLGGFYSINQLKDVYGIDSLCFESIKKHAWVNSENIKRLSLNNCNEKELANHPYVSKYQARSIIKYRELVKNFTDVKELTVNYIFTESEFDRVANYFIVNN